MGASIHYFNYFYGHSQSSKFPTSSKSLKARIFNYVLYPISCTILAFMLYNFRYMNDNIFKIARNCQSITSFGQIFTRHFIYAQHSFLLENLLKNTAKNWKYDPKNPLFGHKTWTRVILVKSLKIMSFFVVTFIIILPFFCQDIDLPQACWVPGSGHKMQLLIYFLQSVCLLEPMILLDMVDSVFLLTGVELEIQFILLRKAIKNVQISEQENQNFCMGKLKLYASYHQFLLDQHTVLKQAFSSFFFLQYLVSVQGLCVEIFVIKQASTIEQIFFSATYIVANAMFLSFAFLAASYLEIEAEALPHAIYSIDWYNGDEKLGKHVLFMLMRAQKPLILTGAGMFAVTRNALLQVYRLAFSISTLLKQV
ncbi:odorant receptor 22b-like [Tribolium castaneum]|uniref:odorant receptor 22b-like n=1 Tax=Tribolium castaneum TaxID=7070 RepID=UPI0001DCB547|nr:PREDICTED: odorant receptor 22b-like [Tribolium castaneum]|eukprot:XP_015839614.1 PREDICTED: odorant receptor 22b-like [Tribolium castaneum]